MEKITLNSIGGYEEEKGEARKLINILKNYKEFSDLGLYLPRGIFFGGPAGCGKTLFAKAIAGEADAKLFIFENPSVTADISKYINDLFKKAKEAAPSIVFIDELDKIQPEGFHSDSDYAKAINSGLLKNLDGISNSGGVLVIATGNNKYRIPEYLFRSGRIEKVLMFNYPNKKQKEEIYNLYLRKYDALKDINAKKLANISTRFTGANIAQIVNDVMIEYMTTKKVPTIKDFEKLVPQVMIKGVKKVNTDEKLTMKTATHEIGHFIVQYVTTGSYNMITIDSYNESLGTTFLKETNDAADELITNLNYLDKVATFLGGMTAEDTFLGYISSGSRDDINKASEFASFVINCGFFGFYLPNQSNFTRLDANSEEKQSATEKCVGEILTKGYEKAKDIINKNKALYDKLLPSLLKERLLTSSMIDELVKGIEVIK